MDTAINVSASQKQVGRRERRSQETRERIFRTALELFAERGFNATTIDAIAEGADIGKGTFFNYFENKESVLLQYREMQMSRIKEFVVSNIDSNEPLDVLIYKLALALTAEQQKSHTLFQSLVVAFCSNEMICARIVEGQGQARETLAGFIDKRQQSGEVRSDLAAVEIAGALQKMVFGTMLLWSMSPERTLEEQLKNVVNVFVSGVRTSS